MRSEERELGDDVRNISQNVMLIVNPFSGRRLSKSALGIIVSKLCDSGHIVTVYFAGEHTPGQLAFDHAKDYEMVVCAGGDGTLSSVVSGLLRSGAQIPVGYIPSGTANDVATSLALSYPLSAVTAKFSVSSISVAAVAIGGNWL